MDSDVGENNTKAHSNSNTIDHNQTVIDSETSPITHLATSNQNESTNFPKIQDTLHTLPANPSPQLPLIDPRCYGMSELPEASEQRVRVSEILTKRRSPLPLLPSQMEVASDLSSGLTSPAPSTSSASSEDETFERSTLFIHLAHGLAYTIGSALGSTPPSIDTCLTAYLVPNRANLTAGSRAWSKHSHRSAPPPGADGATADRAARTLSEGWWGTAKGPVGVINEKSLALFWKVMNGATWRNLHWLPHQVLVYEVRIPEGYGMRWSQDQSDRGDGGQIGEDCPWMFRGFLEPTMENGHEVKWRHPVAPTT